MKNKIASPQEIVEYLNEHHGINNYVGVSDSTLSPLINYLEDKGAYIPFTNEGDAVSYAAACTLAGNPTAVLMQNSGLTNASSPITSLVGPYKIPLVYIVGYRGNPEDEVPDEPQHQIMGPNTESFIKSMTSYQVTQVDDVYFGKRVFTYDNQFYYLINRGTLEPYDKKQEEVFPIKGLSRRIDYIESILKLVSRYKDSRKVAIVSTTGYTSRELIKLTKEEDQCHNFYILGSMGCAVSFAKGLATTRPDLTVILLDGDGSFFMRPSGYLDTGFNKLPSNLITIIFDNKCHLSTGGQVYRSSYECSFYLKSVIESICPNERVLEVTNRRVFEDVLDLEFNRVITVKTSIFIVKVEATSEKNLPRPSKSPEQIQLDFTSYINSNLT